MSFRFSLQPLLLFKRNSSITLSSLIPASQKEHFPYIGNREIVGYGRNGLPVYYDHPLFPYPSIRWQSYNESNLKLKEKEQGDWKSLSIEEKKELYRLSFRQTFAEVTAPHPEYKLAWSLVFVLLGISMWVNIFIQIFVIGLELPPTFRKEGNQIKLYRWIYGGRGQVNGIASKWDFENQRWKE